MFYLFIIPENVFYFIIGFGIFQGVLLSAFIYFHPKGERSVNTYLSLHILFISLVMTMPFVVHFITWQRGNLMQPILLLPAVFLYFYVRSFKEQLTLKKLLPHLLIFLLFSAMVFWNTSLIAAEYPNERVPPKEVFDEPFSMAVPIIQICVKLFYFLLSRKVLRSYQKSIKQLFSQTSQIELVWAKGLVNCYLLLIIAGIIMLILMFRYPQYFNLLLVINVMMGTPYIYFATYKGITQPTIWQLQKGTSKEEIELKIQEAEQIESYAGKSGSAKPVLDETKFSTIASKIVALMEEKKLYQEPELTLQQMAENLGLQTYLVSQAINEGLKRTFYDLVNGYRVEEAKRLLLDSKSFNYTVLSVGFEAGFNSKTTFNTVFKKFTGLTPTEFRDKQRQPIAVV
jgi:AraC-like DNA-binding protein